MSSTGQADSVGAPDAALLADFARNESPDAFRALVERHTEMVYNTCLRKLRGNRGLAQEATQTVFILLARKARQLHSCRNLGYWLYRAANLTVMNMLRQEVRRERREELAMQDVEQVTQPAEVGGDIWQDLREHLDDAVRALPWKQQQAVIMHYFQGKAADEIAASMGCPVGTVRSRIQLARGKLRKRLARRVTVSLGLLLACLGTEEAPAGLVDSCYAAGMDSLAAGAVSASGPAALALQVEKWMAMAQAARLAALLVVALVVPAAVYLAVSTVGRPGVAEDTVAARAPAAAALPAEPVRPQPAAAASGGSIFRDTFDDGLGNWTIVVQGEDGRLAAANGSPSFVRTADFQKQGGADNAAVLDGTIRGRRVVGMRLKTPVDAKAFSVTFDELPLILGSSYRQYLGLGEKTTGKGKTGRWTAGALRDRDIGKWGTFRTEYVRGRDAEGNVVVRRKMFHNGRLVVEDALYTESTTITLNYSVGMVAIDNVVIEEMTPDPIPPSARLENGGDEQ